jgi:hypothetical protein
MQLLGWQRKERVDSAAPSMVYITLDLILIAALDFRRFRNFF